MSQKAHIPITELTHSDLIARRSSLQGWIYPKRSISSFLAAFPTGQQLAINLWGWVAILAVLASLALPFILGNWWWVSLVVVGAVVWGSNRQSLGRFFCENLVSDPNFFDLVRSSSIGPHVIAVFRD